MLAGQDFGRGEDADLITVLDCDDGGFGGDDGLAAADVALQEAVHGTGRRHILGDLAEDPLLRAGGLEGQQLDDLFPRRLLLSSNAMPGTRRSFAALEC